MNRYGYIDAMRGYAILAVIAVHASQRVPGLKWPLRPLADQGARGVQLFYVASALTLCISWFARNDGAGPFYIRRLFRIAPMFWLAIVFFLAVDGFGPRYFAPSGIGWPHVVATATFMHGLHPQSITSVVPGGWTIANEMMFYALFPVLIAVLRSWWSAALAVVASFVFAEWLLPQAMAALPALMPGEDRGLLANYAFFWFPNQFPAFLIGIMIYHLGRVLLSQILWKAGLLISIAAMIALPFINLGMQIHLAYSIAFGVAVLCLGKVGSSPLVGAPLRWMGKISFSAYLWHFAVLVVLDRFVAIGINPLRIGDPSLGGFYFLALFGGLTAVTTLLSWIGFTYIERPFIRLGERIAGNLGGRRGTVVQA